MKTHKKLRLLFVRIQIACKVLFGNKKHMVLLRIDTNELKRLFVHNECDVSISYLHLQKYNAIQIIKKAAANVDFSDEAELKAEWQADIDEYLSRKN